MSDTIEDIFNKYIEQLYDSNLSADDLSEWFTQEEAIKQIRQQIGRELLDAMGFHDAAVCIHIVSEVCKLGENDAS